MQRTYAFSYVRNNFSKLLHELYVSPGLRINVTVRDKLMAVLTTPDQVEDKKNAVLQLLVLARKAKGKKKNKKENISENTKELLYGK